MTVIEPGPAHGARSGSVAGDGPHTFFEGRRSWSENNMISQTSGDAHFNTSGRHHLRSMHLEHQAHRTPSDPDHKGSEPVGAG